MYTDPGGSPPADPKTTRIGGGGSADGSALSARTLNCSCHCSCPSLACSCPPSGSTPPNAICSWLRPTYNCPAAANDRRRWGGRCLVVELDHSRSSGLASSESCPSSREAFAIPSRLLPRSLSDLGVELDTRASGMTSKSRAIVHPPSSRAANSIALNLCIRRSAATPRPATIRSRLSARVLISRSERSGNLAPCCGNTACVRQATTSPWPAARLLRNRPLQPYPRCHQS